MYFLQLPRVGVRRWHRAGFISIHFHPWVGKSPWRRAEQPTPVPLPGESHGQWSLVGYSPQGHKELDTTESTWHTRVLLGLDDGEASDHAELPIMGSTRPLKSWGVPPSLHQFILGWGMVHLESSPSRIRCSQGWEMGAGEEVAALPKTTNDPGGCALLFPQLWALQGQKWGAFLPECTARPTEPQVPWWHPQYLCPATSV